MHATLKVTLSALVALALAAPAVAQDARKPTTSGSSSGSSGTATARPAGGSSGEGGGASAGSVTTGQAVPRGGSVSTPSRRPSREPQTSARRPSTAQSAGGGVAIPSYSRPRGDRAVRGEAVERGNNPLPSRGSNYYYNPYYGYPGYYGHSGYYGYRAPYFVPIYTGFGYAFYDPYWIDPYYSASYGQGRHGYPTDRDDRDYDIGSVRLKVDPSHAEVYVDGLYRGIVDEFDGVFQRLKLEAGAHKMEIRAPGYQPLVIDILVTPGETTTYRGDLRR